MTGSGAPGGGPDADLRAGRPPGHLSEDSSRATHLRVVVLCAGASSRLGEPKALARIGGRAAIDWLLESAAGVDPCPIVVAGRHIAEIGAFLEPNESSGWAPLLVENPRWKDGRTGSVAAAARAARGSDLLIAPADVPLVSSAVFGALAAAWAEAGSPSGGWLAPWTSASPSRRQHGHPIVLGAGLADAILMADDPACPLSQFRSQADPVWGLEVHDEAIHDDLDTPSDLSKLRARFQAGHQDPSKGS